MSPASVSTLEELSRDEQVVLECETPDKLDTHKHNNNVSLSLEHNQTKIDCQGCELSRRLTSPKSHSVTIVSPSEVDKDQANERCDSLSYPRSNSWFASLPRHLKTVETFTTSLMPSLSCLSKADPSRRASKQIDKQLNKWEKQRAKVIQLLLIGSGESGKTTIIKQMKILHDAGFTKADRIDKARQIRENVFEAINEITRNMAYLHPPVQLTHPSSQLSLAFISRLDPTQASLYDFPPEFYEHVKTLWADPGVQQCYLRSNEFFLIDCAKYFLDKLDEICSPDYLPSDQDILRQRRRTSEIQRIEFQVKVPKQYGGGLQSFWMFDVGGQRGERRKWIQVFDGITAVLFLVDSSGYDCRLREDGSTNRLRESLKLFEDIWNSKYLSNSGIILFFNKQDILREKIQRGSKLETYFPEFADYRLSPKDAAGVVDSGEEEYVRARCFIRDIFIEVTKRKKLEPRQSSILNGSDFKPKRECFAHFTTATDTNNVKRVFDDVHTMILMNLIKSFI